MMDDKLQPLLRCLNKMIAGSSTEPSNPYQRGFRDALTLVRNDVRALVDAQPAPLTARRQGHIVADQA